MNLLSKKLLQLVEYCQSLTNDWNTENISNLVYLTDFDYPVILVWIWFGILFQSTYSYLYKFTENIAKCNTFTVLHGSSLDCYVIQCVCFLNEEICDKISTLCNSQMMNSLPRGHRNKMSSLLTINLNFL